ncbi:MAG: TetR/AcrR family transcriptional regulator [Aquabacterium sp.]|nr:MAG: TetR/AcrR family transcriptional regulator [Aquabacterium sp.]
MGTDTRIKMVIGAADLLSRRGLHATSFREVVRHTATPRGSIAHHFPGGKQQLVEEAVSFAGGQIAQGLAYVLEKHGAVGGLRRFLGAWRKRLEAEGFESGCPVLAVAVEHYSSDARGVAGAADEQAQARLLDLVDGVFVQWRQVLAAALEREGVAHARAQRMAVMAIAAVEGALAMCRAGRSVAVLDEVAEELELLVRSGIAPA